MSDPSNSPAPSENSKKGLSPLAWVGIGCGGVVVLGLIAIVVGGMYLGGKAKEVLEQAEGNPERFAAEMVVKFNPDMEMVEANDEEGKMTIRMKKTGEELTFSYADIKEGKFMVTTSDGEVIKVDGKGSRIVKTDADGKTTVIKNDGKTMKVEGPDGKTTIVTATKEGDYWANLPAGLKDFAYPNVGEAAIPMTTSEDDKGTKISFGFVCKDADTEVVKFYREKLKAAGYTVEDKSGLMGKGVQGTKGKDIVKITTTGNVGQMLVMFYAELGK